MTDNEAKKLAIGTILISLSGEIAVVREKTRRCIEYTGKPWGIIVGYNTAPLKPNAWRKATREEIDKIYRIAIVAIDKETL